jgi:hypothetical protein
MWTILNIHIYAYVFTLISIIYKIKPQSIFAHQKTFSVHPSGPGLKNSLQISSRITNFISDHAKHQDNNG